MDAELTELVAVFRTEAADNLATMEQALLALETHGALDADLLQAVLRAAHTLKGNSAIIGYDEATRTAHALEDVLEALRAGTRALTSDLITELLTGVDTLRALVMRTEAVLTGATDASAPQVDQRTDASLRVSVSRLDQLLSLTGEITIARGRLGALVGSAAGGDAALAGTLWQLEQLHAALQEEVMQLRLVPLGPTMQRQHRTVRDVARQNGRRARLVVEGDAVEVDTRMAEQIRDPLTHMIRNAVDHGLEPAAERAARGKDPAGTITIRAAHDGGSVVITVSDDGRGLDRDRIAARAQALGLAADAAALDDDALFAMIFEPGFSTATAVTEVSGRGVGMDVVRRHIQSLRGTIDIASVPGRGTTFTLRLPLTVAIIDGFTVVSGSERYVLPLDAIDECLDIAAERGRRDGVVNLRDRPLPWAMLGDLLGTPGDVPARGSVVVVRDGERRMGLLVDALEGNCQAVIKPLTGTLQRLRGIAGSTILGTGRVALILDVPTIMETARCYAR